MDIVGIIGEIIGFIAMALIILSFQFKKPKMLVFVQCLSQVLFVVHYTMIGSYTGALQNFITVIRAVFLMSGHKKLTSASVKYSFMSIYLLSALIPAFFDLSIFNLLPGISMVVNTYYIWTMQSKKMRLSQLCFVSPMWIIYNAFGAAFSLPGIITESCNMLSSFIFLLRTGKKSSVKETGNGDAAL